MFWGGFFHMLDKPLFFQKSLKHLWLGEEIKMDVILFAVGTAAGIFSTMKLSLWPFFCIGGIIFALLNNFKRTLYVLWGILYGIFLMWTILSLSVDNLSEEIDWAASAIPLLTFLFNPLAFFVGAIIGTLINRSERAILFRAQRKIT